MVGRDNCILGDYAMSQSLSITSSIVNPRVEANNFELLPALISLVGKDQFGRHSFENPNMRIHNFLKNCDTVTLNGVLTNAI